jgi:alpha-tubulin suppressor-like RCC1 family protein
MLVIMVSAVSAVGTTRTALNDQYYGQLAREASESGAAYASACLKSNGYVASWGAGASGKPLRPNTDCTGGDACTGSASCYVLNGTGVKTTFSVDAPVQVGGVQTVSANGSVQLLRTAGGGVWRNYTQTSAVRTGAQVSSTTVAFGYSGGNYGAAGAYFLTIAADGSIRGLGSNSDGVLGNGSLSPPGPAILSPATFILPVGQRAVGVYSNFLSVGFNSFVLTASGDVYGTGRNSHGQLGDGTFTDRSTPVKFNLPAGKKAQYVGVLGWATFVLTTDNYLYASGFCGAGMLGTSYTIGGCGDISNPTRVALPTPDVNDQNTIPTTNMTLDRSNAYIRMAGGRVYGWGANDKGQLGNGTTTPTSVPIKIGTYGDASQPKATQVAFDGDTVYVVDDSGSMKSAGFNYYGQAGNQHFPIVNSGTGKCLDNNGGDGLRVQLYTCNGTPAQQWAWNSDHSIKNLATNTCLDNTNWDGVSLQLHACSGTTAQMYGMDNANNIYNWPSTKCVDNANADGVTLRLWACNGSAAQKYTIPFSSNLQPFELPASATGTIVKVSTDQWFVAVMTSTGEVWGAGLTDQGQLGNGPPFNGWASVAQPTPVKFILPGGVTATDIYVTSFGGIGSPASNMYAVGSNGKVYGAGSNGYGQLGNGNTTNQSTPAVMQVIDGTTVRARQVQSGFGTTIILSTQGTVYTVGNNSNGQLGDGTTTNNSTPRANPYTNILPLLTY